MPRNTAVRKSEKFGTEDVQAGKEATAELPPVGEDVKGPQTIVVEEQDIEVIDPRNLKSKAEQEAFMNEKIVIFIEESDDPNAPIFVHSGHNGTDQYIQRGVEQTVKRRFLYSLVAAKKSDWSCSFGRTNEGNEFNKMARRQKTTHRLHVVRDDNPRGREEFNRWMQEP